MQACSICGATADPASRFCSQCGPSLGQGATATAPAVAGRPPPRRYAAYVGLFMLALVVFERVGFRQWAEAAILDTLIPSLRRVDPFGLWRTFAQWRAACDFLTIGPASVGCGSCRFGDLDCLSSWRNGIAVTGYALVRTILSVVRAGWPVWLLVVPPVVATVRVWRGALPLFAHPYLWPLAISLLMLGCGAVSWAVQAILVLFLLPVVVKLLFVLGVASAVYHWWSDLHGLWDQLRLAHRFAKAGSGLGRA